MFKDTSREGSRLSVCSCQDPPPSSSPSFTHPVLFSSGHKEDVSPGPALTPTHKSAHTPPPPSLSFVKALGRALLLPLFRKWAKGNPPCDLLLSFSLLLPKTSSEAQRSEGPPDRAEPASSLGQTTETFRPLSRTPQRTHLKTLVRVFEKT